MSIGKLSDNIATKIIDRTGDGKAQHRMENYIQNVFYNLHLGKNKAMHLTDDIYKK